MKSLLIFFLGIITLFGCSEQKKNQPSEKANIETISKRYHINYWDDGSIKSEGNYINGKQEGLWKSYREDGKLRATVTFKADKLNGKYTEWNNKGNLTKTGYYRDDIKVGLWARYNSDGDTIRTQWYENGHAITNEHITPKTELLNYKKTYKYIFSNCIKKVTSVTHDELPWIFFNLIIDTRTDKVQTPETDSINIIYTKDKNVIKQLYQTILFRNRYINNNSEQETIFGLKDNHIINTPDDKYKLIIFPDYSGFERIDNILTLWKSSNERLVLIKIFRNTIPVSIGDVAINNLFITPKGYLLDLETHGGDGGDSWGSNIFYMLSYDGELNKVYSLGYSCDEQQRREKIEYTIDTNTYCIQLSKLYKEPTPETLLKSNDRFGYSYPEEWSVELKDTVCIDNVNF